MPKIKTHKGAASRFRVTGTGKIMRMQGSRNNFRRKKRGAIKTLYSSSVELSERTAPRIRRLLAGAKPK